MANFAKEPIRNCSDLKEFQSEMSLNQRLPEQGILDIFKTSGELYPTSNALTMLMTGAEDQQPRRVSYPALLRMIHSAANLFSRLGGSAPAVAYMLPSLIETHVTLWGAETVGYAVPINFFSA